MIKKTKNKEDKINKDEVALKDALQKKDEEAADYLDRLKRVHAEFDNFRKRITRQSEENFAEGKKSLAEDLLGILDNLQRALDSGSVDLEGIVLIQREFYNILKKNGLKKMDAKGENFDHNLHHAVSFVKDKEKKDGQIEEVLQSGYFWKDKVIRPAMVVVVKNNDE
ncbi:MAG: nucleotide exchange factor GrpE [Elusimicrobiota bacterium]|nr:nucleotide exchange factor GrpE [Elusimicrobiota bacterium]